MKSRSVALPAAIIGACGTPFGSTGMPHRSPSGPGTLRIRLTHVAVGTYVPSRWSVSGQQTWRDSRSA